MLLQNILKSIDLFDAFLFLIRSDVVNYCKEILNVLREANPQIGLALDIIAHNVYNMTSRDLFTSYDYEEVKIQVAKFLRYEASLTNGRVEKANKRGYYRLNRNSQEVKQLLLEFMVAEDDEWMM